MNPESLDPGTVLCGRFQITRQIGDRGASGVAYLAEDRVLGNPVVCKLCLSTVHDPAGLLREQYRVLWSAFSPHLVRPVGLFSHDDGPAGAVPVLTLEYIDGPPLLEWARGRSLRERLVALTAVARALGSLHEVGARHDDVHSCNVLCPPTRFVLIDPQPALYGYSQGAPSRSSEATQRDDLAAWAHMTGEILGPDSARVTNVTRAVHERGAALTGNALADALETLLVGPWLHGTYENDVDDIADDYNYDRHDRTKTYAALVAGRDAVIRALLDEVLALAKPLDAISGELRSSEKDYSSLEAQTIAQPRGWLANRIVACRTPDGDELQFRFEGSGNFRKPWPYGIRGLVSRGTASVTLEGEDVASLPVAVTYADGKASIRLGNASAGPPLSAATLERLLRILVCHTVPGVVGSISVSTMKVPRSEWKIQPKFVDGDFVLDRRGQLCNVEGDEWLRQCIIALMSGAGKEAQAKKGSFSAIRRLLSAPPHARPGILRTFVSGPFLMEFGGYIDQILRFDALAVSEPARSISFEIELIPHESTRSLWQFDVRFP